MPIFFLSDQVNRIFPKEKRRLFSHDKPIAWLFYSPILIVFFGVLYIGVKDTVTEIDRNTLGPNEYTDGFVAFTAPDGYMVDSEDVDGMTRFSVARPDSLVLIAVVGGIDTDDSEDNFNLCWEAAIDHSFDAWDSECVTDRQWEEKERKIYRRTYKYTMELGFWQTDVLWDFYCIFDSRTSRYALISAYSLDEDEDGAIGKVFNSIRFR